MWTNGDDFNDDGDRIRLYQPIAYSSGRSHFSQEDATVSYIGGSNNNSTAFCAGCHQSMEHLTQLYIPNRQITYRILGCNQAKCVNQLFEGSKFSMGGGGVFYGERREAKQQQVPEVKAPAPAVPQPTKKEETTNDWTVDSDDEDDDLDLEQQVAAMELKAATAPPKSSKNLAPKKKPKESTNNSWPCFELHSVLEPPGKSNQSADDDEDDFIGSTSGSSDAKIQQMLAKYMEEEEDEDILAALRGTSGGGGGGGGKSREKDERLKASDRALLAFTDRLKRSPRQVLRYAPTGMPLWSIPRPQNSSANKPKGKKSKVNFSQKDDTTSSMVIPPCACCGTQRRFEFQLMPSLLHVLEVDKHAKGDNTDDNLDAIMSANYGGMNWGVIAVYTCPKDDCSCVEDFLVVQASVDETPCKRAVADAPVFIKEDEKFDALCNDGDELEGCNDDDDDEDTVADESDMVFTLDG